MTEPITIERATHLATLPVADALAALQSAAQLTPATAAALARHSLAAAHSQHAAEGLVALAAAVQQTTGDDASVTPWIEYAQGRLAVLAGDLAGAEAWLAAANQRWADQGETLAQARSGLGLTQVLTMQGRFDAAHAAITATIQALAALNVRDLDQELLLAAAYQNLATLLSYQERYVEALAVLQALHAEITQLLAAATDPAAQLELRGLLGQIGLDAAIYQGYLDRPADAEATLLAAIAQLTAAEAHYDRGRAYTNLGHLYTRTGRFATALPAFAAAAHDLLGAPVEATTPAQWEAADVLFLEQGIAHLALNLLPEAAADLDRAITLFAQRDQRYEWGQAIYYRALLALRQQAPAAAHPLLTDAAALFAELDNRYWLNRVRVAQAAADFQAGDLEAASARLAPLLAAAQPDATSALAWDLSTRGEAALLALHVALARGAAADARQLLDLALGWLAAAAPEDAPALYPHLSLQLRHAQGEVARAEGDLSGARRFFEQAAAALEQQRASLPVEDFRTAFLADKRAIYTDLVLALLAAPAPAEDVVASAFAVIERARSRALLERLLAAVDAADLAPDADTATRSAVVRQQLTWLYNQLLGAETSSRAANATITAEIRSHEAALQRIEWQLAPWLAGAEPASLAALQAALAPTEQALVYYCAGDEWLAFVVAPDAVQLVRQLATDAQVETALADLRFQLGRIEIGGDHVARHAPRLLRGARAALLRLHDLLIAPLKPHLHAAQLLIVPYGALHLAPLHAAWDGAHYLVEHFEIHYAPSASVELLRRQRAAPGAPAALVAFALREPSIPQAEAEVRAAAARFPAAQVFVDGAARIDELRRVAADGDVLHFATHGLFRADNPYFSALKLADGWLDVREIYRLPLRARLVVLSACESGAVQVQGGDEAIGLTRGFLGAGAQALVVSLWNVHDASAAQLMTDFYTALIDAQRAPAAALCAAQRRAIRDARHPYFWAPYVAIG